jgi:hypothetical protein
LPKRFPELLSVLLSFAGARFDAKVNWHHYSMAWHLELVLRGIIKRLIIMAPPRTLKSLMASVAFPAYLLGRNPGARIIGISHSSDL